MATATLISRLPVSTARLRSSGPGELEFEALQSKHALRVAWPLWTWMAMVPSTLSSRTAAWMAFPSGIMRGPAPGDPVFVQRPLPGVDGYAYAMAWGDIHDDGAAGLGDRILMPPSCGSMVSRTRPKMASPGVWVYMQESREVDGAAP